MKTSYETDMLALMHASQIINNLGGSQLNGKERTSVEETSNGDSSDGAEDESEKVELLCSSTSKLTKS